MPRLKANTGIRFHACIRSELLLDEYVAASPGGALPESWGFSENLRRFNATLLAEFSRFPDLLKPFSPDFFAEADSEEDRARQILFAKLFASAPDYFLSFVAYFRRPVTARSQVELVAQTILEESDRLLIAPDGRERDDREITYILRDRKELQLSGLHFSVIGKARKLIAEWCTQEAANRSDRHLETMVLFNEWLEELRSTNDVPDSL